MEALSIVWTFLQHNEAEDNVMPRGKVTDYLVLTSREFRNDDIKQSAALSSPVTVHRN